jgi:hypothetical protein
MENGRNNEQKKLVALLLARGVSPALMLTTIVLATSGLIGGEIASLLIGAAVSATFFHTFAVHYWLWKRRYDQRASTVTDVVVFLGMIIASVSWWLVPYLAWKEHRISDQTAWLWGMLGFALVQLSTIAFPRVVARSEPNDSQGEE